MHRKFSFILIGMLAFSFSYLFEPVQLGAQIIKRCCPPTHRCPKCFPNILNRGTACPENNFLPLGNSQHEQLGMTQPGNQQGGLSGGDSNQGGIPNTAPDLAGQGGNALDFAPNQFANSRPSFAPDMLGDTSGGACGALMVNGSLAAEVGHPTFACSRLNIAESNSAVVRNRSYFTYRHFNDASTIDVFSRFPIGDRNEIDIDRFTFGMERVLWCGLSLESRLVVNNQLNSNLTFSQTTGPAPGQSIQSLPTNDREVEFGNLSFILKRALVERQDFYCSSGVGVNVPTGKDVRVRVNIDDQNFQIFDPNNPQSVLQTTYIRYNLDSVIRNETVNLSPFFATLWRPNQKWFVQSFAQVDVPLNESFASYNSLLEAPNDGVNESSSANGQLEQQTLMRINLGVGRYLYNCCRCGRRESLALMTEFHYTTTLEDANLAVVNQIVPSFNVGGTATDPIDLQIGNLQNRVDNLNLVVALPYQNGNFIMTNGFALPLRQDTDKSFDFEYALQVGTRF